MSTNKKITLGLLLILITFISIIFFKLAFGYINSPYLNKKISSYIFEVSGKKIELDEVRLHLVKGLGLAISIPNAKISLKDNINANNTIIDINTLSILSKGVSASDLKITTFLSLYKDQLFNVEIISKDKNIVIKKFSSDNFSIIDEIILKNNNYHIINVNSVFKKSFIDQNLKDQLKKIENDYGVDLSNLFFKKKNYYKTKLKIDLRKQEVLINKLENKHQFNLKFKIDYSKSNKKLTLNSTLPNVSLVKILNNISIKRNTNNKKILKIISESLYKDQYIEAIFTIDKNLKPRNILVRAAGQINLDYQLDKNQDPSFVKGIAPYDITIIKEDILNDLYEISSNIDLNNIELYIRQINLVKALNQSLNIKINSSFDITKNIQLSVLSSNTDIFNLNGTIELSDSNDFLFKNLYISNNDNVDLNINGSLQNRKLVAAINGLNIDLSKNIIKINDKIKDYYFKSEDYKISTDKAYLVGGLLVDNFKITIDKMRNKISVQSSGDTVDTSFKYLRTKDTKTDVSIIDAGNIINSIGPNHSARNIISKGKAIIKSHRIIGSLVTDVEIDLENFVLINTPATLKLLSLPSFSGLSSALSNETGIEFAYGKLNYKVNTDNYSEIKAFAVNDGIGLVLEGNIDRKNKLIDLDGQISPLHLISGIIQKIPFFGKILIGDEGEGILAVEYSMSGNLIDPEVSSNPLTIFKPRLFERILDFFSGGS
ncbi:hypothetical protein N9R78_00470 [Pelagibacteraceae bacterium]|nr:hypothetical protein [Pelagibacteraceae bacterium]